MSGKGYTYCNKRIKGVCESLLKMKRQAPCQKVPESLFCVNITGTKVTDFSNIFFIAHNLSVVGSTLSSTGVTAISEFCKIVMLKLLMEL